MGYGKHGVDGIIASLEEENNTSLDKKEITVKGTLLYNDRKLIVQISAQDKPLVHIGPLLHQLIFCHILKTSVHKK